MKPKSSGCTKYTITTVAIPFPEDHVCCALCPLMETYSRKQCRSTGEYLMDSQIVGMQCPLKLEDRHEI